jgi:hypothetical protein
VAGWYYILEAGGGDAVLFLTGDTLTAAKRYENIASIT